MSKIFVCGLCNIETSCSVREFPIEYSPVDYNFFGISSAPSGVALNISLALTALGDESCLVSYAGNDPSGDLLKGFVSERIPNAEFLSCPETPQSVILYDTAGVRKIYTDLKDMQERSVSADIFDKYKGCDAFCICNINFARGLLPLAKASGKPVFTDVHCLSDIHDSYNADFLRESDVVFLSNDSITGREERFARELALVYQPKIIVVGMGERGALLYERDKDSFYFSPAVYTRPVVNTVGAGDALFSAFVHFYTSGCDSKKALDLACRFASYKIGESGASKGFISEAELLSM